jgi:hypothetical protein
VPTLEPTYYNYLPLKQRLTETTEKYGEQRNLLLMDNNVLASERLPEIIEDIKACGFAKNAVFYEPNHYEIAIMNLQDDTNDNAYIRKLYFLIAELENKMQTISVKQKIYEIRETHKLLFLETTTKENLLKTYPLLKDFFFFTHNKSPKQRFIDFNQGVDARLFTEENTKLLSEIAIRPLRIAFDEMKTYPQYNNAIRLSAKAGLKDFSNYLLYNFKDKPIELWQRLKINIDLCNELDINIYSFPMKFHPIKGEFSHNRDFIGEHWNRKYIRAVQAILNSTKGKIGRDSNKSESFFGKAFGHTEEEFLELLEMPETMIIYRFFFEWLDGKHEAATSNWQKTWKESIKSLEENALRKVLTIIHNNNFTSIGDICNNNKTNDLLKFYTNYRADIIKPDTELYKLKQEYDKTPTRKLKRKTQSFEEELF